MNNNVVLKAVGLQKSYKEGGRLLHVLKDVNLEVHEGESVAIVGTSGSGKTTLLQCIGGLDRFDKGLIEIGGKHRRTLRAALNRAAQPQTRLCVSVPPSAAGIYGHGKRGDAAQNPP
jgi:ABC-type lipoprotein export system ATPase subunit